MGVDSKNSLTMEARQILIIFILIISYISQTKAACLTEEGDACVFPFKDGGKSYSFCAKHNGRFWCSTENKADGKYEKWGYCPEGGTCPLEGEHAGPVSNCKTTSGKSCTFPFKTACVDTKGNKCVFPFTYKDVKYEECTDKDGVARNGAHCPLMRMECTR